MNNHQRTAEWLKACGKEPSEQNLSVQIGCHIEEFFEFMQALEIGAVDEATQDVTMINATTMLKLLHGFAEAIKDGHIVARIADDERVSALDALCDCEVTGNGVAYLAGFNKVAADELVLASNEAKLVDGKPVLKPNGKIGKPEGWVAPDLSALV